MLAAVYRQSCPAECWSGIEFNLMVTAFDKHNDKMWKQYASVHSYVPKAMTVRFHCLTGKRGGASTQKHELVPTSGCRLRGSAQKEQASQSRAQRSMQSEGKLQEHQTSAFDFKSHMKNDPYSPEKLDPPGIQRTALKELPQHWDLNMQLYQFLESRAVCLTVQPSSTCDGCHLLLVVIWRPNIAQILN